jgi:hypothetical protein
MTNKTISIPEYINDKLSQEENASGLITQLLIEYFKTNVKSISEIEARQEQIEKERKEFVEKYSEDYATLEKRKQVIKQEVETEEQTKERMEKKREAKINNILNLFKDETGKEMSKEELTEYLERFENEKGFNIFKYIDELRENVKN